MQLRQIPHSAINHSSLNAEILHPRSHDAAQHGAELPGGLLYHSDGAGLRPVDPVLACGEAMLLLRQAFGQRRLVLLLGDEFECRCGRDYLRLPFLSTDEWGEGDWLSWSVTGHCNAFFCKKNKIKKYSPSIVEKENLTNVSKISRVRGAAFRHLLQLQQGIRHLLIM